jgi:carbon starvation protein
MQTVLIAFGSFVLYLVAYRTYGRFLARRVFRIDPGRAVPSIELEDGVDYVPSRKELVFGHHFTSIAGTGPIVGPAVAVVWGWVPALLWVLIGSVVMGAVHDFGSLVISMRHQGRTIGDLAGTVVNPRVRLLFLLVVLVGLWIVLGVFGLVIAAVFTMFPSSVVPVFLQIPIAVGLGIFMRRGGSLLLGSVVAVGLMYASIVWSASINWSVGGAAEVGGVHLIPPGWSSVISPVAVWTFVLLAYVYVASVLPVQWLLQPRDYINSHQLLIAMGLLVLGLVVSHPPMVASAVNVAPKPAVEGGYVPSFLPFLFVTIACGAISGFHCLVASGCSSRQLRSEKDAQYVGYGAMLTEAFLATLVILACAAGIGLGTAFVGGSATLTGEAAWLYHYETWGGGKGLSDKLAPFIRGSANMITSLGIGRELALAIMGVFVASFAATTLDSATRLQRYVIAELAGGGAATGAMAFRFKPLTNRFVATGVAVVTAAALALSDAFNRSPDGSIVGLAGAGKGGLTLWPIFGATNQLLGGLALLVITVWLVKQRRPAWVSGIPMVFMLAMTGWAIVELIDWFASDLGGDNPSYDRVHLLVVAALMLGFEIWIVIEAVLVLGRRGSDGPDPMTEPVEEIE